MALVVPVLETERIAHTCLFSAGSLLEANFDPLACLQVMLAETLQVLLLKVLSLVVVVQV